MNKWLIISITSVLFGVSYLMIQPSEQSVTAEIKNLTDALGPGAKNKSQPADSNNSIGSQSRELVRQEDGRLVVKGLLPRELKPIRKDLRAATKELKQDLIDYEKQHADQAEDDQKMAQLIAEADQLIVDTNARLGIGIDSSHIAAEIPAEIPLAPEFEAIKARIDAIKNTPRDFNEYRE